MLKPNGRLQFTLEAKASNSKARAARFRTLHNEVLTPLFMPVGTRATVRHQCLDRLDALGSQILLANTYHLHLSPGPEVFKKNGGIHKFMNWGKSVLTDSGGFQIFSLPNSRQMTEEGASFKSYITGDTVLLSPEQSIQTQMAIGSDIMMVLDQCVPSTVDHQTAKAAMELSYRWAKRSMQARGESAQSLFGIIQGACYQDLRKISAELTTSLEFDGFAIGGLAVGETKSEREDFTEYTTQFMPENKPRYLMGVGTPIDLLEAVHRGVDMFDCIIPTALASQGVCYTSHGRIRISRGAYKFSTEPLDANCSCRVCRNFSRSYLHHLIKTKEPLGASLIGEHNVAFYHNLMSNMRSAILDDTFYEFYKNQKDVLASQDESNPVIQPKIKKEKNLQLGNYQITTSKNGGFRIQQKSSGEVMHSVIDPMTEAMQLYVNQSNLEQLAQQNNHSDLVVWDVGLGAAYNAMATIQSLENLGDFSRNVCLISFENDLDALRLAVNHSGRFSHLHHPAPSCLLKSGEWQSQQVPISWKLILGDFLENLHSASKPDIVFYDPFSSKADSALWTLSAFEKLLAACQGTKNSAIYTYSASTAVRTTLLAAGFWVAKGVGTGPKSETTVAFSAPQTTNKNLLGEEWLSRWERSHTQTPLGCEPSEKWRSLVTEHPQFRIQRF